MGDSIAALIENVEAAHKRLLQQIKDYNAALALGIPIAIFEHNKLAAENEYNRAVAALEKEYRNAEKAKGTT